MEIQKPVSCAELISPSLYRARIFVFAKKLTLKSHYVSIIALFSDLNQNIAKFEKSGPVKR